jgi:hypothetical protein
MMQMCNMHMNNAFSKFSQWHRGKFAKLHCNFAHIISCLHQVTTTQNIAKLLPSSLRLKSVGAGLQNGL